MAVCACLLARIAGLQAFQAETTGRVAATVTTLEGAVHLAGVQVELVAVSDGIVLARTTTDGAGLVTFPDVPPGRYVARATRAGFVPNDSAPFDVRAGEVAHVLLDIQLTFVIPEIEVRPDAASPTDSVQPVSMSDMPSGSVLDLAPLEGDDFQSLMLMLPGVVRDVPGESVESVEVLANPFAAEFGRFSTSITQVRTRRGTNQWEFKPGNFVPRLRKSLTRLSAFEPRLSARGPLRPDRAFIAQDLQFRYVTTRVRSLPGEPEIGLSSFDSFTRLDTVLSPRHTLGGGLILFPREISHATMNTFRPREATPDFNQSGWSTGLVDRFAIAPDVVLESTLSARWFEVDVNTDGQAPMVYAPQSQRGSFFNDQERDVASLQWVEALSLSHGLWRGRHVFKIGSDVQRSHFDGFSRSRPVEIRRLDGSLAELITADGHSRQHASGVEAAVFAQDRWRLGSRVTFELGLRMDRHPAVQKVNWSPRAGAAISVLPDGRAILRGGSGKFVQRTPLNVVAFPSYESRAIVRFLPDGSRLGPPLVYCNVLADDLQTPEAYVGISSGTSGSAGGRS